jgi:DNA repair protein RadD
MALRDFQQEVENGVFTSWNEPNVFNVMTVMPTGAGKTVLMGDIIAKMSRPTCAIAHRQELVSQVSLALNREGIHHGIVAPEKTKQQIIRLHHETHGFSRYSYRSDVRVAGVDSLRDVDTKDRWFASVGLTVIDEGHHVLAANKWGKAFALFPNSRGLFLTAHAYRADGCGLGRHASGLVDRLVLGPTCRELINRGYLTDYDIYCPESDLDFSEVHISPTTGEYIMPELRAATHKSKQLVGDVVRKYVELAYGKLGVTFAVDIEEAKKLAAAYNAAGVPAEIITAKTPINIRGQFMRQFRERRILQLVSVDCLGEGVDVPAIEVVSLARRTASFQVYAQQVGRSLRPMVSDDEARIWGSYGDWERLERIKRSQKPKAIIIDHVGNTVYFAQYHGRLCSRQSYTLDDRESKIRPRNGADSLRPCSQGFKPPDMVNIVKGCLKPYEKFYTACPYCGVIPFVAGRAQPEQVDGDIVLLDPAVLIALQNEIAKIDGPPPEVYEGVVGGAIVKNHYNRQRHQASLRHIMAIWGGWRIHLGEDLRQAQKRFYLTYGVDVITACTLGMSEADALATRIQKELTANNVVEAMAA